MLAMKVNREIPIENNRLISKFFVVNINIKKRTTPKPKEIIA